MHVSQLRKLLGRDLIETRGGGYVARVRESDLDQARFELLVEQAGASELAARGELLREALALWRGEPLAELDPTARSERARLAEQRLAAIEQRMDADLQLGRHNELVAELEGLVRAHPLRERLRGQLMIALYRSGRQADALESYRAGRHLLGSELGLEPGEELRRLERAILEQDPSVASPLEPREAPTVPTGTVTFLFTDIEDSTTLVRQLGDDYGALLEEHYRVLVAALEENGGQEIESQSDAFLFAFRRARDAVRGAVETQRTVADSEWPQDADVRVRIGVHTGEPGLAQRGYHGLDLVQAARISGVAHGGQILVSSATRDLTADAFPDVSFRDLGEHDLEDIGRQRIFQVLATGLREEFPPLRRDAAARVMTIGGREAELAAAAEAAVRAEERRARLFRRSRVAAAAGALLLVGAIAAAAVVLTGGSGASSVVVLADSVAVIDTKTNQVTGDVLVGARPIAIAVGEGAVWVANADDGTVSRIDPETRKVVKTIGIGSPASDIAAGQGSVWVANGSEGTVSRIDPRTNTVITTIDLSGPDELAPSGAYSVAVGYGAVWVGSGQRKVIRLDPATGDVVASVRVGQTPADVTTGEGAVWVAHLGGRTLRIEPQTNSVTGVASAPGFPVSIAAGAGGVWVGEPGERAGTVWRVDPATVSVAGTTPVSALPLGIATAPKAVWVAGGSAGTVVRIDPGSGRVLQTVRVGNAPLDVAVGKGRVWTSVGTAEASS